MAYSCLVLLWKNSFLGEGHPILVDFPVALGCFFVFTWLFSAIQFVICAHGLRWHDDHGLLWHMVWSCSCCDTDTVSVYNWDVTLEVEPVPPLTHNCWESVYMCQSRSPRIFSLDTCSPEESIPPISHSTGIADLHIEIDILNALSPQTSCFFFVLCFFESMPNGFPDFLSTRNPKTGISCTRTEGINPGSEWKYIIYINHLHDPSKPVN